MRAQKLIGFAVLATALSTASCASLSIPKRGFLTRYFQNSSLQDSVTLSSDLAGRPTHPFIDTYRVSAAPQPAGSQPVRESAYFVQTQKLCDATARQRASDVAFQGFGDTTQKSVFDQAYADCMSWSAKH